ncbi:hypothetical protein ACSHUI_00030 [Bacillus subtilis]|uniref:hypothetical protein n=1 Tax=Bacillus subtilis TaxID=1423 RepID=UPI003EF39D3C
MAFNAIEAENCWDAYMKTLKLLLDNNFDARNVFLQINNTEDNYVTFMPHDTDPLFWYLRVNSDTIEGELGIGVGLDVRYDARRMSRVKGHGTADWSYRGETGRAPEDPTFLNVLMEEDEIFPNASYQANTRVGGRGQLHAVKDLLMMDKGSDKGIVTFWHYQRDLLEYTRRKYLSKKLMGDKKWSDSQHQRIPCPTTWHFSYTPDGITNNVYSRSLIWDGHIYDDMFRFPEPAKWIGGHLKKSSSLATFTIRRLWQKNFGNAKERWRAHYDYWSNHKWIKDYFEPRQFYIFKSADEFELEWMTKELAEQDYRLGAFEDGDRKLKKLKSQYYREWVKAMKVADMTIAHRVLGQMLQKGIVSRPTKRALDYVDSYTLKQAILDIDGIFRVQCVQWVVNYMLRSGDPSMNYKEILEILPDELQELVLVASLGKVNKVEKEAILTKISPEVLAISDYNDLVISTKPVTTMTPMASSIPAALSASEEVVEEPEDIEEVEDVEEVDDKVPSEEDVSKSMSKIIASNYSAFTGVTHNEDDVSKDAEEDDEDDFDIPEDTDSDQSLEDMVNSVVNNGTAIDFEEDLDDEVEEEEVETASNRPIKQSEEPSVESGEVLPVEGMSFAELLKLQLENEKEGDSTDVQAPEEPEVVEEEDEDVRKPIVVEGDKPNVFIAAPYGGSRVDKTLGDQINKAADNIDYVYFPLEPFHYREVKRHGTQLAVDACVANNIPMIMETRKVVPEWAIEALAKHKDSELRVHLNTMDNNKWKTLYPNKKADSPTALIKSFIDSFQGVVHTVLKISPIVPGIITKKDVLDVIEKIRNWTPTVQIGFASFTEDEYEALDELLGDKVDKVKKYYYKKEGKWFVSDEYREEFLAFVKEFLTGSKIKLEVMTEAVFDGEDVSTIKIED